MLAVADVQRSATGIVDPAEVAVVGVLTRSGRWVVLHGVLLTGDRHPAGCRHRRTCPPKPYRPQAMSAYGLTEREQQLTRLRVAGLPTIERSLITKISVHTVQGHLRSVFTKPEARLGT